MGASRFYGAVCKWFVATIFGDMLRIIAMASKPIVDDPSHRTQPYWRSNLSSCDTSDCVSVNQDNCNMAFFAYDMNIADAMQANC